jgi:hypothetical protein
MEELLVNYEPYHRSSVKPRGFQEFCDMYETHGQLTGLWEMVQWDPKTGKARKRVWAPNVVTDNGAINILASAIANASNANPWNNILITNNDASCTLAAQPGVSPTTSINVTALPAALPANSNIQVGFGGATKQTIVGPSGITAQGVSGSLTVPSWTPTINYPIGTAVVPVPSVTDNPTNAGLVANATTGHTSYSGVIASGGFVYTPTTGAGNRQVVVTFVFKDATNGGSTIVDYYTSCWLVNVTSGASNATTGLFVGNYIDHLINTPMRVDDSNNCTATVTVKL